MPLATRGTVISGVALLVAGIVFLALSLRQHARGVALDERGAPATAIVTRIVEDPDSDTGFLVEYAYGALGAQHAGSSRHVSAGDLEQARRTSTLAIRYLPDDPAESAPARGTSPRSLGLGGMVLAGAALLAGIALALVAVSTRMRTGRWWMP